MFGWMAANSPIACAAFRRFVFEAIGSGNAAAHTRVFMCYLLQLHACSINRRCGVLVRALNFTFFFGVKSIERAQRAIFGGVPRHITI